MTFPTLADLMNKLFQKETEEKIEKVEEENVIVTEQDTFKERQKILIELLRQNNYWPTLQFKKFFDCSGLVLLYNSQKISDYTNENSPVIYKECRSVIIDLLADTAEKSIVSKMYIDNPSRIVDTVYETKYQEGDVLEAGYEGTMIHVYYHKNQWYFSTTSCPNIDGSRYFHPTKTHGMMFNDVLMKIFPNSYADTVDSMRNEFTQHLDVNKKYLFVLIHHENKHIIDYTPLYGNEYMELVHIATYDETGKAETLETKPLEAVGIRYAEKFNTKEEALTWLRDNTTSYAVIVKKMDGTMLKVCREDVVFHETTDLGNANPWHNMLWIFLQNRSDYTIADYIKNKKIQTVKAVDGKFLSPTFVLHIVISSIVSYLYKMYYYTTYYNPETKELIFKGKIDKTLAPIMRFHLVQLRDLQKTEHADRCLTHKAISGYLRSQQMKNMRLLIQHFAENSIPDIPLENQHCIQKLSELLRNK